MELYSKRNGDAEVRRYSIRYQSSSMSESGDKSEGQFISNSLRNRLREVLKYVVKSGKYLESFTFVDDQESNQCYLHDNTLKDLSLRELGYDVTDALNLKDLTSKSSNIEDLKFFDLIELIIILTKEDQREDLVVRLNNVFKQEKDKYQIHGYMIISKINEGLRSTVALIKDKHLREKLNEYYENSGLLRRNYESLARISSDMVQLVFSSPESKEKTKDYSLELCKKVATKWTEKEKVEELTELLSETVLNTKKLFNNIKNLRHTDRTTIPVELPNFYKLINTKNIHLVELIILSLPENYIMEQSPEEVKNSYLENYRITKSIGWTVKKKIPAEINIDDIPF